MAHYYVVTRLDPSRDIAWIRLGYKKHKDRWVKPDDLAAQKLEAERQKHADTQWKPRLEKLREAHGEHGRDAATEGRAGTLPGDRSPRVPMIWKIFGNGSEKMQLVAVELLSQIEGPAASFWLAVLAIEKPSPEVRERAARALAHRDPRDVIGRLISLDSQAVQVRGQAGQRLPARPAAAGRRRTIRPPAALSFPGRGRSARAASIIDRADCFDRLRPTAKQPRRSLMRP